MANGKETIVATLSKNASLAKIMGSVITDTAKLDKESKSLATSILNNDKRIEAYLFSEVLHIEEHRNQTRLNIFLSRVKGSGQRVNAMFKFINVFANVEFHPEAGKNNADGKKFEREENGLKYTWWFSVKPERKPEIILKKMEQAANEPWYTFAPEPPPAEIVLEDKAKAFLRGMWDVVLNGPPKENAKVEINHAFLNELTELAYKHGLKDFMPKLKKRDNKVIGKVPEDMAEVYNLVANENKEPEAGNQEAPKAEETKAEIPAKRKAS
jgi:hypothetical protein